MEKEAIPAEVYEQIKKIVRASADETLPPAPRKSYGKVRFFEDKEIKRLSDKQRKLTSYIYRMRGKKTKMKRKRVKKERNEVFKAIRETEIPKRRANEETCN